MTYVIKVKDTDNGIPVGAYGPCDELAPHGFTRVNYFAHGKQDESDDSIMPLEDGLGFLFPVNAKVKVVRPRNGTKEEYAYHRWKWEEDDTVAIFNTQGAVGEVKGTERGLVFVDGAHAEGEPFPYPLPFFPDELEVQDDNT